MDLLPAFGETTHDEPESTQPDSKEPVTTAAPEATELREPVTVETTEPEGADATEPVTTEPVSREPEAVELEPSDLAAELERLGIPAPRPGIEADVRVTKMAKGSELNVVKVVVAEALKRSTLEPGFLAEVRRTFAEPGEEFDSAFAALRSDQRLVVLRYRPDTGTRTAAVAMIAELARNEDFKPHYLRVGGPTGLPTAALASESRQAYLMDLTVHGEESGLSLDFGLELKAVSAVLKDSDSYLIVITGDRQWRQIGRFAPVSLVHELEPPRPELVARKWLEACVPGHDFAGWFADPQIAGLLDVVTPREAVEIAELIKAAVAPDFKPLLELVDLDPSAAGGDVDLQLRVRSVVATRARWRSQLLNWHKTAGRTAFERTFLLTTAVLRGFPVAAAYKEAKNLCEILDGDIERVSGHSGPGVIELLDTIRADTTHDESVRFPRQRWAEAVLAYYWQDRPDEHDAFIKWLTRLPHSGTFLPENRAAVAERVSEVLFDLIMNPDQIGQLGRVIDLWSAQEESRAAARSFLDAASLHPRLGRAVAQMMLRWSTGADVQRRIAVAVVCGSDFGRLSTDKALVRLSYLIDSGEPEVVAAAEQAVVALWKQPETGRELLERLVKWASDRKATYVQAARNIFTRVAALPSPTDADRPDLLVRAVANEADLNLVAKGWRCLLESEMASGSLVKALRPWFEAARAKPDVAADVLSVFERATTGSKRAQGRLEKCVYIWHGSTGVADWSPAGHFVSQIERFGELRPETTAPEDSGEENLGEEDRREEDSREEGFAEEDSREEDPAE